MMANVNDTQTINIVPVQGVFGPEPTFTLQYFVGPAGTPFFPPISPDQSGLVITNSTIDSSVIGGNVPAAGTFTNITATTGTILTLPSANTDIANKQYVDSVAQGLNIKAACLYGTTANITLSGLGTQAGGDWPGALSAGARILVKNQNTPSQNGIYVASASSWSRSTDMSIWDEVPSAFTFVEEGTTLADTGWVCTSDPGGTINVTAIVWTQFSGAGTYLAGTGLTLTGNTFSISNTGVTAASYGNASSTLTATVNAQGQLTALSATSIAISASQITSGTIASSLITGSYGNITGVGVLTAGVWNATPIANSYLANSSITINGTPISLGGSATITAAAPYALTIGTGLSGTSYNGSSAVTIANTGVLSFSGGSTGLTPNTATTGAVTLGGTLAVANGGTGVTSSSGANSVVLRDANQNVYANKFIPNTTTTTASTTPISLTNASSQYQIVNGSTTSQKFNLPDATTLAVGATFYFNNNITYSSVQINANDGTTSVLALQAGGSAELILLSNSTTNGTWDVHSYVPSTASWGTATLSFNNSSSISGAVSWQGNVIGINYGGTNGSASPAAGAVAYGTGTAYAFTSAGTSGQVLQSNGSSAPTWVTPTAYATVTDDTTSSGTRYPLFANQTTGNLLTEYTSSTKLTYVPNTGVLTATGFAGSGASLTSLTAGNLSGTIPSAVLGNSTVYIGTTAIALNRASASINLTGTSIDGSAGSATTATTATNANNIAITDNTSSSSTWYPVLSANTSGNNAATTSSTKISFVPSTGVLTLAGGIGGGAF
jgi:hypothetical protein